ncbi:MAG: OmpA family protein [Salinivirgaceae bacterium]|jgi:outer membrane protein OmpA-like peptidoglycan-associated protein|nr:OmpA family protein [Salinivirgaceae bacterium]
MHKIPFLLVLLFLCNSLSAQLLISQRYTPDELVRKRLVKTRSGVKILSVKYRGSRHAIGYFMNKTPSFDIKNGIVLSTGFVQSVAAPNRQGNTGSPMGYAGDRDLSRVVRNRTNDAAALTIEFVSYADSVQFNYFFGSEEYPEYVNKGVNDVFAFFIRKSDEENYRNMAVLPNGKPVTVDNINARKNKQFYIANDYFTGHNYDLMQDDPARAYRSQEFMFDGFTTELVAATRVEPYQTYELKIAIADVGDDLYDSGVFLKSGSFMAPTFEKNAIHDIEFALDDVKNKFDDLIDVKIVNDTVQVTSHIAFEIDTYRVNSKYASFLDNLATAVSQSPDLKLNIYGHTDATGTEAYNETLSLRRARSIADYLAGKGVDRSRMNCEGYGSKRPIADESTEEGRSQNRRVEFYISL